MLYKAKHFVLAGDATQQDNYDNDAASGQFGFWNGLNGDPQGMDPFWPYGTLPSLLATTSLVGGRSSKAGQTGPTSTSTSTSTPSTSGTGSSTATGSFVISINWDTSVQSAPSGFVTGVTAAVQYLESLISDPVTITSTLAMARLTATRSVAAA